MCLQLSWVYFVGAFGVFSGCVGASNLKTENSVFNLVAFSVYALKQQQMVLKWVAKCFCRLRVFLCRTHGMLCPHHPCCWSGPTTICREVTHLSSVTYFEQQNGILVGLSVCFHKSIRDVCVCVCASRALMCIRVCSCARGMCVCVCASTTCEHPHGSRHA